MYGLSVSVYGIMVIIPIVVVVLVPCQTDGMILGSNAIKWLISWIKVTQNDNLPQLVFLLSNLDEWELRAMVTRMAQLVPSLLHRTYLSSINPSFLGTKWTGVR